MPKEKLYESNVGDGDLELGQEYFGSIVTKVQVDIIKDNETQYKIKRTVTLRNGVVLLEDYWRSKSLGKVVPHVASLPPKGPGWVEKDDSAARAK
eukprot:scaffold24439_cov230-Cylindrotheca_fusiformis.AAC.1